MKLKNHLLIGLFFVLIFLPVNAQVIDTTSTDIPDDSYNFV